MSRTYRRKDQSFLYKEQVLIELKKVQWNWNYTPVDRYSKLGKKLLAEFHADSYFCMQSAPHWYRRHLNKKDNSKERLNLINWFKNLNNEIPKPVRKKSSGYYW